MTTKPTPADVGAMYDRFTDVLAELLGGSVHLGYWNSDTDDSPLEVAGDRLTNMVAARLAVTEGQHVLDVGCGSGRPAVRIATGRNVHVTGITVSAHQLELAQARPETGDLPGQASFQHANAMDLPFEDATFDGAYAIESMLHIHDKNAVLAHIARVLRPGARLVIADMYLDGPVEGPEADLVARMCEEWQIPTILTADDFRKSLDWAGLDIAEFTDIRDNVRRSYRIIEAASDRMGVSFATPFSELKQLGYTVITAVRP
jgi:N-methyltransferase StaMA